MAQGAELPIQFAGEIEESGHSFQSEGPPLGVERLLGARPVQAAVRTFPGRLDVPDHAGVRLHQVGFYPSQLVGMALSAGLIPPLRLGWVLRAEHAAVGSLLFLFPRIAAVTGHAGGMRRGSHLDPLVAPSASRIRTAAGPASLKDRKKGEEQDNGNPDERTCKSLRGEGNRGTVLHGDSETFSYRQE